jgi:alpha-glucosidase
LYVDDGESIKPNTSLTVDFVASGSSSLFASVRGGFRDTNALANVTILGVPCAPETVTLNNNNITSESVSYNSTSKVLVVNGLQNLTKDGAWSGDWVLKW